MRNNNLNLSNYSQNEFISNDSVNMSQSVNETQNMDDMSKMMMMFQQMASNPYFKQMMEAVSQKDTKKQPSPEYRKREFQHQQYKYRNNEISPRRKQADQLSVPNKQERKKGTDVLRGSLAQQNDSIIQKYIPAQNTSRNYNSQDRPINSAYAAHQQMQQTLAINNQSKATKYNDDDRPINPAKGYAYETTDLNKSEIMNNSMLSPPDPNKYKEAQERPVRGITGDFKQFIMAQEGFPISQQPEEGTNQNGHEEGEEVHKTKTFLKRGSRQFLSSAKDRSVPKPKLNNKSNVKQDLNTSTNNFKESERPQRSISQNRVLGRKSVSSKSITKKIPKPPKEEEQNKTLQYSNTVANHNINNGEGSKTPKAPPKKQIKNILPRETSTSPTFQRENSPKPKKNQKKNIFQESSSQEQDNNPRFSKATQISRSQNDNFISQNKTQVIPGVFLSKKQLHQILTKYGKAAPEKPNTDDAKIQELKNKYLDLCNILAQQKRVLQEQIVKQKEQFEVYKQTQMTKIKNERKVQERNLLNNQKNKEKEKQKEDFENLRKVLQKERQEFKHKEKNYKIMIEKYKKLAEERERQPSIQGQQSKLMNYDSGKNSESSSMTNKKKQKNKKGSELAYQQNEEMISNSQKGDEQAYEYRIAGKKQANNSFVRQNPRSDTNDRDRLPNYQDLKKPNIIKPPQDNNRNRKYEYYQELDNKQTVKQSNKYKGDIQQQYYNEPDIQSDKEQEEDKQEVVEYNPSMKLSDLTKIPLNIKMVTDEMIENLFRYHNNPQYKKYLQITKGKRNRIHTTRNAAQKKTTNMYTDGGKQVIFDTGVRKQYFSNGYIIIFFTNGDIKQKLPDQTILYFYKQKQVDQITLPNKINIYRFDNNQVEFHFEDRTVQIRHPDGTFKMI